MMETKATIEERVQVIEDRNARVEADKAWETSLFRRVLIAVITYFVIVLFFWSANLPKPFINAIVPTIGFLLSTLTLSVFKKWWIRNRK